MAETREKAERSVEQTMQRAEDTIGTILDNNRRTMQTMIEFNRNSITTGYEFARNVQEEGIRLTDIWFDNITRFQKNYMKSFQDYSSRYQDMTAKTIRENQDRVEETLDQSIELVTPGGGRSSKRR